MAVRMLSQKPIPSRERLIVALDVETSDEARQLVARLGDSVVFYKLGLELFAAGNYFALVDELVARGKRVFLDLKLFDIPATVGRAVARLTRYGADFVTVHGNDDMIRAAVDNKKDLKILGVTVLTSLDERDIADLGFENVSIEELVLSRARRALAAGCDGIVSSGLEVPRIRAELGDKLFVVSPGIRPVENRAVAGDQKRVVTLEAAFTNGADYIVVGRPIRNAADPAAAAEDIQRRIGAIFASS